VAHSDATSTPAGLTTAEVAELAGTSTTRVQQVAWDRNKHAVAPEGRWIPGVKDGDDQWRLEDGPARAWAATARKRKEDAERKKAAKAGKRKRQGDGVGGQEADTAAASYPRDEEIAALHDELSACRTKLAAATQTIRSWEEYWARIQQADEHHRDADAARSEAGKKLTAAVADMDLAEAARLREIHELREALGATRIPRSPEDLT